MCRKLIYSTCVDACEQFQIHYYLTEDVNEPVDKYGVEVVKLSTQCVAGEFSCARNLCSDKDIAQNFLGALYKGRVPPVSLPEIVDDFLSEVR